ncbi:MAG TPA: hypothetical protein DCX07_08785 [Phycisphaerales bacterium]|nr:hypothetical protein [Phycisphaerales bacterium]
MRDIVFVSHANPEDNDFCRWLTLRLAREGYPVWLDLKRLLGGENFWADIEDAIRNRAVKVLYALSRTSNTKPGALKELSLAQTVAKVQHFRDFVIPLKIDDLPHADININLHQLNAISFEKSWAEGFQQLLLKLEQDAVQKDTRFSPDAVTTWWRTQFNADAGVVNTPEDCLSNWFAITHMPTKLFCHEGKTTEGSGASSDIALPYPTVEQGGWRISFADAAHMAPALTIRRTIAFATKDVIEGLLDERYIPRSEAKKIVSYLLVDNWVRMMRLREMSVYQLSNHRFCGALRQNQVSDDKITFAGIDGKSAWRGIIGYKTMQRANGPSWVRFWHFAVQGRAQFFPVWAYLITNHVVFSEDGQHLWDSRERQHSARRSQCKNWWNDDWRDRMLAMMTWLAEKSDRIAIDCGGDVIEVSPRPLTFASPVRLAGDHTAAPTDADEREMDPTEMDDAEDEDDLDSGRAGEE